MKIKLISANNYKNGTKLKGNEKVKAILQARDRTPRDDHVISAYSSSEAAFVRPNNDGWGRKSCGRLKSDSFEKLQGKNFFYRDDNMNP